MIGKAIARAALAALFAVWFAASNLAHADVTVGAPAATGSGDCIPFGCNFFDFDETFDYQQVYGSTNFSTPITITDLEFFNTVDFSGGGTEAQAGSYVLSLSTTQAAVNGLSTDLSGNLWSRQYDRLFGRCSDAERRRVEVRPLNPFHL